MKLDYHGDSGIVEPRGNVRIQTQTPAQGILSAMAIYRQRSAEFANSSPIDGILDMREKLPHLDASLIVLLVSIIFAYRCSWLTN